MKNLVVILVRPQMGENIGFTIRAMANFGATDLRLVSPRDGWPNPAALSASAGTASHVSISTHDSLSSALKDLGSAFAVTARQRDIKKTVLELGTQEVSASVSIPAGLVFGPEKAGLTNEDVSMCNYALTIPTSPLFPSMNLSHAVAVCLSAFSSVPFEKKEAAAPKGSVDSLLLYLEQALSARDFFYPIEKGTKMKQNLRDLFLRAPLSVQDINTLFGAVKCLAQSVDKSEKGTK